MSRHQVISWMVLLYFAISLSVLVSHQAARIATKFNLNPRLFTAHFSSEVYKSLDDPFKPRIFSYLMVAPFVETDLAPSKPSSLGRISAPTFERLVMRWSFAWFLATALLLLATDRPLVYMFGTAAGVSFAYSLQEMVYPYDLPALFFATLAFVLVRSRRHRWLPWVLAVGVGFKETVIVFSVAALFAHGPRKTRWTWLAISVLACSLVMVAIDLYSGRPIFGFESFSAAKDPDDPSGLKVWLNLPTLLTPSNFVWAVNAGLALPLFLLPTRGHRLAQGFRCIGLLFAAGLFLFAGVGELRIWFELIPLCLHNILHFLDPSGDREPNENIPLSPALARESAD